MNNKQVTYLKFFGLSLLCTFTYLLSMSSGEIAEGLNLNKTGALVVLLSTGVPNFCAWYYTVQFIGKQAGLRK